MEDGFLDQLYDCVIPCLFVEHLRNDLLSKGYSQLNEAEKWDKGKLPNKFFVIRNDNIIVINWKNFNHSRIFLTDVGTPCINVSSMEATNTCNCRTLKYTPIGDATWFTWQDRDLRLAGFYEVDGKRVKYEREEPFACFPSLAAHLSPHHSIKPTLKFPDDYVLVFSIGDSETSASKVAGIPEDSKKELYLIDHEKHSFIGIDDQKLYMTGQNISGSGIALTIYNAFIKANDPSDGANIMVFTSDGKGISSPANKMFFNQVIKRLVTDNTFYSKSFLFGISGQKGKNPNYSSKSCVDCGSGISVVFSSQNDFPSDTKAFSQFLKSINNNQEIPSVDLNGECSVSALRVSRTTNIPCVELVIGVLGINSIRELVHCSDMLNLKEFCLSVFNSKINS